MANKEISGLTAATTADTGDTLFLDVGGNSRRIQVGNALKALAVIGASDTGPNSADVLALYEAANAVFGRLTLANLFRAPHQFDADTGPNLTDEVATYEAAADTARRMTMLSLFNTVKQLTTDTGPSESADYVMIYSGGADAPRKATPNAIVTGKMSVWVPAGAMTSRTTNGAAAGSTEMSSNKNMFVTKDFDTTTQEFVQFEIGFPKSWNLGTVTFQPVLSHASGTGNVVFGLAGVARSNDDAGDAAFGTAQTSDRTIGTANDIYIGPESAAITIAGSPAQGDTVQFQLNRTVASDNLGVDARLHGCWVYYGINAVNDD